MYECTPIRVFKIHFKIVIFFINLEIIQPVIVVAVSMYVLTVTLHEVCVLHFAITVAAIEFHKVIKYSADCVQAIHFYCYYYSTFI